MAIHEYRPNNPLQRSKAGFHPRYRYQDSKTPFVRIALDEDVSKKIAMLRFAKKKAGESLHSLSSFIENAVFHYWDYYFTDRELPSRGEYDQFLKTSKR